MRPNLTVTHPNQNAKELASGGELRDWYHFHDDFLYGYDTTFDWAVVEDAGADTGDALTDAAGGILNVGCDGDDNDECYVSSKAEIFKFAASKPLIFEARIQLTEANTDDANWIIGLSDTVAANSLVDNGAGPMASYGGAVFFKVDGSMYIGVETSNTTTQATSATALAFVSATWYTLRFEFDPNDGTTGKVTFFAASGTGAFQRLAQKDITLASLAEMHVLLGVKAGGANEENLLVDYVDIWAKR